MNIELCHKYERLKTVIREHGRLAVAFSGGVDSTLLAKVAHDELGDGMLAVTAQLHSVPRTDLDQARAWCGEEGIPHVVRVIDELSIPGFAANPKDRCYVCKRFVFGELMGEAARLGFTSVADGSNLDDAGDYRPGMRALEELRVTSPLRDCGFTKSDVRALSRELGLPTWNKPSAACLSSRVAYGETITQQKLERIEAAEQFLHDLGFENVRVRIHGEAGTLARIEVPAEGIAGIAADGTREQVAGYLRNLGFVYVSLDLLGFRSGAMNEVL